MSEIKLPAPEPKNVWSNCNEIMRGVGQPYPRTCKVCGLGPCKGSRDQFELAGLAPPAPEPIIVWDCPTHAKGGFEVHASSPVKIEIVTKLYATDPNPLREMIERLADVLAEYDDVVGFDEAAELIAEAREMLK